jgi:NADH-quinone oxidoreductase subunit E
MSDAPTRAAPGTDPLPGHAPEAFAFTEENQKRVETILARYPVERKASAVLPLLTLAQAQSERNWLPQPALDHVADLLGMPVIRVYEVASFYDMFNTQPVGKTQIRVCTTTPCWLCGSDDVVRACKEVLGVGIGETTADGRFFLREFECLGACANAPMLWIDDDYYEDLDYDSTRSLIEALKQGDALTPGPQNGRKASMPAGGKTTLLEDPHRMVGATDHGPGERDEEPSRMGRPGDEVKQHHEEAARKKGSAKGGGKS